LNETNQRSAGRTARILDAAADLFAHYGYDKTTMDDIARAAHVSKGAIYLHFRSKDDLFDALMLRETDLLQEMTMARLEADGGQLTIFSLYRHSIQAALERPLIRAMLTSNRRVLGDFMERVKRQPQYEDAMAFRGEFVRQLQQAGMIRADADPDVLAALLIAVRYGYLSLSDLVERPPAPEETGEMIAVMLQRAFGTDYGNSEAGRAVMRQLFERGREFMQAMREQSSPGAAPPAK